MVYVAERPEESCESCDGVAKGFRISPRRKGAASCGELGQEKLFQRALVWFV
jgi:hypothetical protein